MPRCTMSASAPSRRITRYLPRRCTDAILCPSSWVMNSFLFAWRITSTSGSSGIVVPLIACFFLQAGPGDPRRSLFGLLLRATFALPVRAVTHVHGREEVLRMVGALVANDVTRSAENTRGRDLLQTGLVVAAARPGRGVGDPILQAAEHDVACN